MFPNLQDPQALAALSDGEVEAVLRDFFDDNYNNLRIETGHQLAPDVKEAALQQVLLYWQKMRQIATKVTETEVKLTLPGQTSPGGSAFGIEGIVDIVHEDGKVTMYDLKTHDVEFIRSNTGNYEGQLNVYAHIWQQLRGRELHATAIVSTVLPPALRDAILLGDETRKAREFEKWNPVVEIPFNQDSVSDTIHEFGIVVDGIESGNFAPPSAAVIASRLPGQTGTFAQNQCRNCDARYSCASFREYSRTSQTAAARSFREIFPSLEPPTERDARLVAGLEADGMLIDLLDEAAPTRATPRLAPQVAPPMAPRSAVIPVEVVSPVEVIAIEVIAEEAETPELAVSFVPVTPTGTPATRLETPNAPIIPATSPPPQWEEKVSALSGEVAELKTLLEQLLQNQGQNSLAPVVASPAFTPLAVSDVEPTVSDVEPALPDESLVTAPEQVFAEAVTPTVKGTPVMPEVIMASVVSVAMPASKRGTVFVDVGPDGQFTLLDDAVLAVRAGTTIRVQGRQTLSVPLDQDIVLGGGYESEIIVADGAHWMESGIHVEVANVGFCSITPLVVRDATLILSGLVFEGEVRVEAGHLQLNSCEVPDAGSFEFAQGATLFAQDSDLSGALFDFQASRATFRACDLEGHQISANESEIESR